MSLQRSPVWKSPTRLGAALALGAGLAAWGIVDLEPERLGHAPLAALLGVAAGVGAALVPLDLRARWVRLLRVLLLVPTVSILPTALVMALSGAGAGRVLAGAALVGAAATLLVAERTRADPVAA